MKRHGIAFIALLLVGLVGFATTEAQAQQALRAERTFYIKPRIGLANYHGDLTENFTFAFDKEIPYSAGIEFGYQISRGFAVAAQTNIARFASLSPHMEDDDRVFNQLILRYTGRARTGRIAPFIQAGIQGTDGLGDIAVGPAVGAGLDIALSDQLYLMLEFMTQFATPDDVFDADGSEKPEFDFVSYVGPALKYNFKSPFTAADVMALECPTNVSVGESATFTASTNSGEATPPVTYSWNFGEGSTANGTVATHTFGTSGTYTVRFTASNNGVSDSESCIVNVAAQPMAAAIVTLNADRTRFEVCEPATVTFDADIRGDEPMTYQWDFGNGTTGVGEEASATYTEPGTYTVTLRVSNPHGQATRTMTVVAEDCIAAICMDITEMNSVYFARNSSELSNEAEAALAENVDIFEQCPNVCGEIVGYAAPGERNPQELSEARANAVEDFYDDAGLATSRFQTEGRGVLPGTTKKEGAAQARRVDTIPTQCN